MEQPRNDNPIAPYMLADAYKHIYKAKNIMRDANLINYKIAGDFSSIISHIVSSMKDVTIVESQNQDRACL